MLVINSSYVVQIPQIEPHRPGHADWVRRYIDAGVFLLAGPRKDKSGGVIVARDVEPQRLSEILAEDPYVEEGLVENQIIGFDAVLVQAQLSHLV